MSPGGSAAGAYGPRRAAPEPNKRALYVGGLEKRVTEEMLKQIFETTGHVVSVKIIPEKNVRSPSPLHTDVYAFRCDHLADRLAVQQPQPELRLRGVRRPRERRARARYAQRPPRSR